LTTIACLAAAFYTPITLAPITDAADYDAVLKWYVFLFGSSHVPGCYALVVRQRFTSYLCCGSKC
jgi:hypothetical protein